MGVIVKIYSVGVWNYFLSFSIASIYLLKFTPLEFETQIKREYFEQKAKLKFTPLEFETSGSRDKPRFSFC